MAVKEKPSQGGGLGPVVEGEDHLPVGSNTCLVLFLVSYPAGVLNSTTAHSKSTTVSNITLLCPSLGNSISCQDLLHGKG